MRRHDIDWLRTLALGLLIIYHAAICFQPFFQRCSLLERQQAFISGIVWVYWSVLSHQQSLFQSSKGPFSSCSHLGYILHRFLSHGNRGN